MLTYKRLSHKPHAMRSLTGLSLVEFEQLLADLTPLYQQHQQASTQTKRHFQPRRRAPGGGSQFSHDLATRLLLTLFWLRVYPTYEVLGVFANLDKSNAWHNVQHILGLLEQLSSFAFERPSAQRRPVASVQAVMDAFPDVRLVIDAKEQRIRRPSQGPNDKNDPHDKSDKNDKQKPYYSGKQKTHTIKTQVAVSPDGQFQAISQSVPGGAVHDLTLLRQSRLLDQLDGADQPDGAAGEAAMLDKGYDGIAQEHPELRLYLPYKARRGHPLSEEQKAYNSFLARYRIIVDHSLAQLTNFQVLRQTFRQQLKRYNPIFRIVATLVTRRMQVHPLKNWAVA